MLCVAFITTAVLQFINNNFSATPKATLNLNNKFLENQSQHCVICTIFFSAQKELYSKKTFVRVVANITRDKRGEIKL